MLPWIDMAVSVRKLNHFYRGTVSTSMLGFVKIIVELFELSCTEKQLID